MLPSVSWKKAIHSSRPDSWQWIRCGADSKVTPWPSSVRWAAWMSGTRVQHRRGLPLAILGRAQEEPDAVEVEEHE